MMVTRNLVNDQKGKMHLAIMDCYGGNKFNNGEKLVSYIRTQLQQMTFYPFITLQLFWS